MSIQVTFHLESDSSINLGGLAVDDVTVTVADPPLPQNFDGVTAPTLPAGWTTDVTGIGIPWTTVTSSPVDTAPNAAFGPETNDVGLTNLNSPTIPVPAGIWQLRFRNLYNLETNFDGMVLEINIGADGGGYADIVAAGGSFVTGGYNGTLSTLYLNPLPGRAAWTNLSGGTQAAPTYITTLVNLPPAASGQNIQLRWRVGSDNSVIRTGLPGARIDTITLVQPPTVLTGVASGITTTGATLNGTVNPNGTMTLGSFEYGLTAGYGSTTGIETLGAGNVAVAIGGGGITGLTCGTVYHFRAVAITAIGTTNGSDAIFATTAGGTCAFTDDPLTPGTAIKAVHITQLRSRIDALRVRFGPPGTFPWTNPLTAGTTFILAVHITEMRTALDAVYNAKGVTPLPTYTDPGLADGTPIKAVHITQLRAAVVAIE